MAACASDATSWRSEFRDHNLSLGATSEFLRNNLLVQLWPRRPDAGRSNKKERLCLQSGDSDVAGHSARRNLRGNTMANVQGPHQAMGNTSCFETAVQRAGPSHGRAHGIQRHPDHGRVCGVAPCMLSTSGIAYGRPKVRSAGSDPADRAGTSNIGMAANIGAGKAECSPTPSLERPVSDELPADPRDGHGRSPSPRSCTGS